MLKYRIQKGKDHYNNISLFRVLGVDNEYVGEWAKDKNICEEEIRELHSTEIEKFR